MMGQQSDVLLSDATIEDMLAELDRRGRDAVLVTSNRDGTKYAPMPPDDEGKHVYSTPGFSAPVAATTLLVVGAERELARAEAMLRADPVPGLDCDFATPAAKLRAVNRELLALWGVALERLPKQKGQ